MNSKPPSDLNLILNWLCVIFVGVVLLAVGALIGHSDRSDTYKARYDRAAKGLEAYAREARAWEDRYWRLRHETIPAPDFNCHDITPGDPTSIWALKVPAIRRDHDGSHDLAFPARGGTCYIVYDRARPEHITQVRLFR